MATPGSCRGTLTPRLWGLVGEEVPSVLALCFSLEGEPSLIKDYTGEWIIRC